MASGTRVRWPLAALVVLSCGVLAVGAALVAPSSASAASTSTTPAVRLLALSATVSEGRPLLRVALTRTGPAVSHGATVQLTVYSRLTTRSALESALAPGPGPSGPVSSTPKLSAACLAAGGQLRLTIAVRPSGAATRRATLCGATAPVLRLGCASGCDGVYPLRVTVADGTTSTSLVTLLTFASSSTTPLRVVWMLRVAGEDTGLGGAAGALTAVAAHPKVPVTIDVEGSAVATGMGVAGASTALGVLRGLAAPDQLVSESYVPVDLGALRASGLRTEVRRQYALGGVVLATAGVTTVPARTVTYGTGPQTPTSANALSSIGFHHVLVDGTSLAEDPSSTLDWGYAFRFADAPHGPTALASDTELSALSDDTTADPGLVASQLLGELAFLHFEEPDLVAPRAVVLVTDATRAVSTAFVGNVLQGLRGNPVLAPVTASAAFRDVPVGPPGFPATRALALGPSAPLGGATSSYVQSLRIQIEDLRSAVTSTASSPVPALEGALLSAEAVGPTVSARRLLLDHVHGLLADQQGYFRIYDGTITLTESGATLPITVFSSAPYSVKCTLVLSSGKLVFPMDHGHHSTAVPVTLSGNPYSVRVSARALVTGDLPLTAELYSPDGRFVLAHALITVRATGTSVVGIVLTVVALLVLALWWLRTSRKRRAVR